MVVDWSSWNEDIDGTNYKAPKLGWLLTLEKSTDLRRLYF